MNTTLCDNCGEVIPQNTLRISVEIKGQMSKWVHWDICMKCVPSIAEKITAYLAQEEK